MKFMTWFFAMAGICTASGCSSPASGDSPIGFTFESTAGTLASFGWTGLLHDVESTLGTPFGVKTTKCTKNSDGSTVCQFEGPTDPASSVSVVNRRRCLFRMSRTCTADGDCPLDGGNATPCVYIYDAPISTPLPSNSGAVGACGWSYIPVSASGQRPTITGTLNLTSGDLDIENLTILAQLNSNSTGFFGACAECVGDPTPNDGRKDGICMRTTHVDPMRGASLLDDGPDVGRPCDVNRYGTIPGYEGSYSMDCSPTVISGVTPTPFGGSFKSLGDQISITDQNPMCSDPGVSKEHCYCGMCKDGKTVCASDVDCGDNNGPCANVSSDPTANNNCLRDPMAPDEDTCKWNSDTGLGSCTSKLTGRETGCYPSGANANIIGPGDVQVDRNLSTIYYAKTASARCIAAGSSAKVNLGLGLPGLLFQKRNFKIVPELPEDQK